MKNKNAIENWMDRIIENTKDEKPKNPEKCHEFFMLCPRLYPSNNNVPVER